MTRISVRGSPLELFTRQLQELYACESDTAGEFNSQSVFGAP